MEEEDADRLMLSSLGITSANPEDIERKLLSQANNSEQNQEDLTNNTKHEYEPSSSTDRVKLYNELRAVEVEINAVASTIEKGKSVGEGDDAMVDEDKKSADASAQFTANGLALQQALARDRLGSLKRKKAQIQKEISDFNGSVPADEIGSKMFLAELVKDKVKKKPRLKEAKQSVESSKRRRKTVDYGEDADFDAVLDAASAGFVETERDELVRKGILTPFHKLEGFERRVQQSGPSNRHSDSEEAVNENLTTTSFAKVAQSLADIARSRPTTKLLEGKDLPPLEAPTRPFQRLKTPLKRPESPTSKESKKKKTKLGKTKRPLPDKKWRVNVRKEGLSNGSDGDARGDSNTSDYEDEIQEEMENDHVQEQSSVVLEGGLKIPEATYNKLFDYQKVGVKWLWELHCQRAGGIIGDEMGLGKTVQVLSYLGALHFSGMYKPSIVVCPVTLLQQWQREAKKWYPQSTVEILHDSARVPRKKSKDIEMDSESEAASDSDVEKRPAKSTRRWDDLIDHVVSSDSGLLLTTYEQLRILGEKLLDIEWGYAILDEGHRIRNPNAEVTLVCKQLQTVHRIIMTGAPIQNKLTELWSLFDFVFPGKLGVLPVFEKEFAVPISIGGYANASPMQVSTAYRCAVVLRDLIMPYLLRRMKADVNAQLTKKTEHVLFCSLTPDQRSVYRAFLASSEVEQIFDGRLKSFYGIDVMRKICNHPDLLEREHAANNPDYGNPERSGKMKVLAEILKVWKEQGHRALLFAQTQQMLDILENFMIASGYNYRRMDGNTPVRLRMALIDEFNNSADIFVFILTTKVGGLGTNLVGANRVIIFDPDWNPSTDMQARERAWRIGQVRDVTVYRLVTRGTIEEKVYHRQIYKHFLTNKILKNPQQRRFFKARDMKDLFILQDDYGDNSTETSDIFSQLSGEVNLGSNNGNQEYRPSSSVAPVRLPQETSTSGFRADTSGGKAEENENQGSREVDEETNILKTLFEANGIHSAMNHDTIMNANDNDKMRMEEEASKVAQRAAEALRESRMLRSRDSFALPTWTGRSGSAGAPSAVRRKFGSNINTQLHGSSKLTVGSPSKPPVFSAGVSSGKALSSAELLARMKGTEERAVNDALEHELGSSSNQIPRVPANNQASKSPHKVTQVQPEVLIRQLCSFMQQRDGCTSSSAITQHFKDRIRSEDLPLFKNLLKEIATLKKDFSGSRWELKPDYSFKLRRGHDGKYGGGVELEAPPAAVLQEVLQATRVQLERELALEDVHRIRDLPAYNLLYK